MNSAGVVSLASPPLASRERIAAVIAQHSRSFALASRLLPAEARADAVLLYAYCRRTDDAIDCAPPGEQLAALAGLRAELDAVYAGREQPDELLRGLQTLVRARKIPRVYFDELLHGMAMDAHGTRYRTVRDLLRYAHRVAGTVGLMMCHTLGVRHARALVHAAHLGIAMQLTNIARDVGEDWARGRLYLPDDLLARHGAAQLAVELDTPLPPSALPAVARALDELLELAGAYYRSADLGLRDLGTRCGFSVRVARLVYAEIGAVVRSRACDPLAARAVVSTPRKLWLLLRALAATVWSLPRVSWTLRPAVPHAELDLATAIALPPRRMEARP